MNSRRALPLAACLLVLFAGAARSTGASSTTLQSCETQQLRPLAGPLHLGSVPIIFIHGVAGDPSIFTKPAPGSAKSLSVEVASLPQTTVWTFDYHDVSLDWVTNPRIGPAFAASIACLARATHHRVIVIAHSMGGLATQYAASRSDPEGGIVGEHIAHVFAIATPFTGSELLTAVADAVKGGPRADPAWGAVADALLSECAGYAQSAYRNGAISSPCGVLSVLHSPVGTALQYQSPEIRALPRWPASVPVTDIAGEIDLTFGIWKLRHAFNIGDVAVSQGSATAHNTSGSPVRIICHESLIGLFRTPCYHSRLPQNSDVVRGLLHDVRGAVDLERGTFLPAATGPNDWSSYLPVIAGRTCTYRATATVGQFTSVAEQASRIDSPQLKADGVHFSIHSTTTTTTTGPGIQPESESQTMTYPYVLANDGTVRTNPGSISRSGIEYGFSGFEIWPTLISLREGKSITTTIESRFAATTEAMRAELRKALHGPDEVNATVTLKVGPAPPIGTITTPAGTFTNTIGVRSTLVSEHVENAPLGTDAEVMKAMRALGPGATDVYLARGVGIVETKQGGPFASLSSPPELVGCSVSSH